MRQGQPVLAGSGLQRAERADGAMTGSLRSGHRLDQQVIGVCFPADGFGGVLEEHFVPIYTPDGEGLQEQYA